MSKSNYEELMNRYVNDQVTEDERVRIEVWLDNLVDKKTEDLKLTYAEQEAIYRKLIDKNENLEAIRAYKPQSMMRNIRNMWVFRVAAGLMVFLFVGYLLAKLNANDWLKADQTKMILADGTIVWLNDGSSLTYYEKNDTRFAQLTGEGLFEVAKNPTKPFLLSCGEVSLKVIGTSFTVKGGHQIEVKVLTGVVKVTTKADTAGLTVAQHEEVTYTRTAGLQKGSVERDELNTIIANTEYNMSFVNATLGDVLERIEKKFNVHVSLENSEAAECHVNIDITDNSLENSLKKITAILNVEYKIDGSAIKLTGSGCK